MRYAIDHDYHIHSLLSTCSGDPEQNTRAILSYGEKNGFKKLCLTDHFWDETVEGLVSVFYKPQNFAHITEALPLPQGKNTRFYFGCETELREDLTLGISKSRMDKIDFCIIPTTHFNTGFVISETNPTLKDRINAYKSRLDAVLSMNLPFSKVGIAHLACSLIYKDLDKWKDVLDGVSNDEYHCFFEKAAKIGVGIELNADDFNLNKKGKEGMESVLRVFRIAKEEKCKFYLGSDAHHPKDFESAPKSFEFAVNELRLSEDDKFCPFDK